MSPIWEMLTKNNSLRNHQLARLDATAGHKRGKAYRLRHDHAIFRVGIGVCRLIECKGLAHGFKHSLLRVGDEAKVRRRNRGRDKTLFGSADQNILVHICLPFASLWPMAILPNPRKKCEPYKIWLVT